MQTLNFIGNSSAFSNNTNNCAFYKKNNYLLLFDCGEDIFKKIKNSNLLNDINEIDIFISHLHGDHAGGLSTFLFYCFYIKHIKANIIVPEDYNDLVTYIKITDTINICNLKYIKLFNMNMLKNNIYINVEHSKHSKIPSYSILLRINTKVIYYSGDTYQLPNHIIYDFKNGKIDELYCDTCGFDYENNPHLSLNKLYKLLNGKFNNRVYCMHLDNKNLINDIKNYGFNVAETTSI